MKLRGQALFRSYGRFFAEFLEEQSLVRLGLLDPTTCVGLRYGPFVVQLEVFLGRLCARILPVETESFDLAEV